MLEKQTSRPHLISSGAAAVSRSHSAFRHGREKVSSSPQPLALPWMPISSELPLATPIMTQQKRHGL